MTGTTVQNAGTDMVVKDHEAEVMRPLVYDINTSTWQPLNAIGGKPLVVNIDYVHQKTHEGRFFSGGYYNAALADAGTLDILVQLGAVETLHAIAQFSGGGDLTVDMYEGTTFSAAGTAFAMTNHNRSSSKVFAGTTTHTPTVTGVGTALGPTMFVPGGAGGNSGGGSGGFEKEFILKINTVYLLRITNVSGLARKVFALIQGYQPTL
jgi:hypothetical protein